MNIIPAAIITDLEDKPIKAETEGELTELTLGLILIKVLDSSEPTDTPATKVRRFDLALKISRALRNGPPSTVAASVEDVADIKALVGKNFSPLIVGRVYELLDPAQV